MAQQTRDVAFHKAVSFFQTAKKNLQTIYVGKKYLFEKDLGSLS